MIQKHWKKIKMFICIITAIIVFSLYLYSNIIGVPVMNSNEIITLPTSGISMPYWLFNALGYILLPGFCSLIVFSILDRIEERYVYC